MRIRQAKKILRKAGGARFGYGPYSHRQIGVAVARLNQQRKVARRPLTVAHTHCRNCTSEMQIVMPEGTHTMLEIGEYARRCGMDYVREFKGLGGDDPMSLVCSARCARDVRWYTSEEFPRGRWIGD